MMADKNPDICIGLLEFRPIDENFIKLGKLVWEKLTSLDSDRKEVIKIAGKNYTLSYSEVIVRGR